jgi:kynurenine formamidase
MTRTIATCWLLYVTVVLSITFCIAKNVQHTEPASVFDDESDSVVHGGHRSSSPKTTETASTDTVTDPDASHSVRSNVKIAPMSEAEILQLFDRLSNWGRWGPDDEIGVMNLITKEKRAEAMGLVRDYFPVSCARPIRFNQWSGASTQQAQRYFLHTGLGRSKSDLHGKREPYTMESISMVFHGMEITHMDSLAHFFWLDKMYNNRSSSFVSDVDGALKSDIQQLRQGIVTRGVLIDIPLLKGYDFPMPLNQYITPSDLDAFLNKYSVDIRPGDIILLRTGFYNFSLQMEHGADPRVGSPGLHPSAMSWLRERDVAALGTDTPGDVFPAPLPEMVFPTHILGLVSMGMHIIDNADFERLAVECRTRNRWEFMLTLAPLPLEGVTGSPLNPIATF